MNHLPYLDEVHGKRAGFSEKYLTFLKTSLHNSKLKSTLEKKTSLSLETESYCLGIYESTVQVHMPRPESTICIVHLA